MGDIGYYIQDILSIGMILLVTSPLFVLPLVLTVINGIKLVGALQKKEFTNRVFRGDGVFTLIIGTIYTALLYGWVDFKEYTETIYYSGASFEMEQYHTPIGGPYMPTFIVVGLVALIGYCYLANKKFFLPPLRVVVMTSTLFAGIIVSGIYLIQISNHMWKLSMIWLALLPLNYILCSLVLLLDLIRIYQKEAKLLELRCHNKLLEGAYGIIRNSKDWMGIGLLLAIPLLGIISLILTLFGQSPDALIKGFTETGDWVLSQHIAAPSVQRDGHYLCTVAVGGHKKIVKPLRYGIRHGHTIVVNRQLLVANAFEQLIEEKCPKVHKWIRNLYDTYGYPIAKHMKTAVSCDIIYVIMKPLEYMFLCVLYWFDDKPENRIAKQYLPKLVD